MVIDDRQAKIDEHLPVYNFTKTSDPEVHEECDRIAAEIAEWEGHMRTGIGCASSAPISLSPRPLQV